MDLFDEILMILDIPHTKESAWYADRKNRVMARITNENSGLHLQHVVGRSEQLFCDDCNGKINELDAYCKHCGEVIS